MTHSGAQDAKYGDSEDARPLTPRSSCSDNSVGDEAGVKSMTSLEPGRRRMSDSKPVTFRVPNSTSVVGCVKNAAGAQHQQHATLPANRTQTVSTDQRHSKREAVHRRAFVPSMSNATEFTCCTVCWPTGPGRVNVSVI